MVTSRRKKMTQKIHIITLQMPLGMGTVNCFIVQNLAGYFLVDTGLANAEKTVYQEIESAGCTPDNLKLVILTHGDFDHIGNVVSIKQNFGVKIAMHADDVGMAEKGDMFASREKPNMVYKVMAPFFTGFSKSRRFKPDIILKDGDDLNKYGLDGKVINLPGHSKGSIGILLSTGDLFCGDLLDSVKEPTLTNLIDNQSDASNSLMRLKHERIKTVYPGHGDPFDFSVFTKG
jgi:glyoxylase-like metal-dependent hydrolase (beta-lactamase superfamily II)